MGNKLLIKKILFATISILIVLPWIYLILLKNARVKREIVNLYSDCSTECKNTCPRSYGNEYDTEELVELVKIKKNPVELGTQNNLTSELNIIVADKNTHENSTRFTSVVVEENSVVGSEKMNTESGIEDAEHESFDITKKLSASMAQNNLTSKLNTIVTNENTDSNVATTVTNENTGDSVNSSYIDFLMGNLNPQIRDGIEGLVEY